MLTTVDTSAMSIAVRRRTDGPAEVTIIRDELERLSTLDQLILPGVVRQELLSGFRELSQYERVRSGLRRFPDLPCSIDDYERAAEFANTCQRSGIQGSPADFLICAIAVSSNSTILTLDGDFARFAEYIPIRLHPLSRT